eukprot:6062529-Pleurochrysis_carterae.AAC.1
MLPAACSRLARRRCASTHSSTSASRSRPLVVSASAVGLPHPSRTVGFGCARGRTIQITPNVTSAATVVSPSRNS